MKETRRDREAIGWCGISGRVSRAALGGIGAAGLLIAAGTLPAGCGNTMSNSNQQVLLDGPPEGLRKGVRTTVGVRPDTLGAARELPVPMGSEGVNGAMVAITGTLHSVAADWIVIDDPATGLRHWIQLDSVSWIRQATPPTPSGGSQSGAPSGTGSGDDHGHGEHDDHSDGTHGEGGHG